MLERSWLRRATLTQQSPSAVTVAQIMTGKDTEDAFERAIPSSQNLLRDWL